MTSILKKKKTILLRLDIDSFQRNLPFDIKMPANVKKITGIKVTAKLKYVGG